MGILNLTPDSFSDGGRYYRPETALRHGMLMVDEGAAIIDIGGESTRPGAQSVTAEEELERVIPVIETLAENIPVPISIDTSKPLVMREAVSAGAGMINDVLALGEQEALQAAAETAVPVCLMHMQGKPRIMQNAPHYDNVVEEVKTFLQQRMNACESAGIARHKIVIDPGFGFGKSLQHNLKLLKELHALSSLNAPLLVGISRKSMIGSLLGDVSVDQRIFGSLAAAVVAVIEGATIIRVHDVHETVEALKVASAVRAIS
ncbi:MAG: dihydropteroate synthase [Candidatus Thiodiazotropha sp. (ex Lucinoma aequizonata)]|nr:dihydropteroate synthase [Candidatus Thiodiazotropha sp. (ex Lucinoma aequizonata)]MCU7887566.1 dihydropteroate synthase [Candidatus Thiodiazotropha sp. (ex Lucinoma aequizonata)]MCU7895239.1 dihydropteroate synthase [Candidatus Thiodiazotropha sp. (ex Lucinoma aequizonata)]MCU7900480.1 dihydropteroate synthase [Candidatus Thiodiazotropha sp. (ex Lucinoma aequizonata)]MCU7902707.1 dihydropteroate synthase [Candidatus Thiodiazotropha sp. (ex Lucinoma aequizonata)]